MRKLNFGKVEGFSQGHTEYTGRMGGWSDYILILCCAFLLHVDSWKKNFYSFSWATWHWKQHRLSSQDAASGPVSLAGPASWLESKDVKLWLFLWWGHIIFHFCDCICPFPVLGHLSLSSLCLRGLSSGPRPHFRFGGLAGPDRAHDFILFWGLVFTWHYFPFLDCESFVG